MVTKYKKNIHIVNVLRQIMESLEISLALIFGNKDYSKQTTITKVNK